MVPEPVTRRGKAYWGMKSDEKKVNYSILSGIVGLVGKSQRLVERRAGLSCMGQQTEEQHRFWVLPYVKR